MVVGPYSGLFYIVVCLYSIIFYSIIVSVYIGYKCFIKKSSKNNY